MSEPGFPPAERPQAPPMEKAEYRSVALSHAGRIVFAIIVGVAGTLAVSKAGPNIGFVPTLLLVTGFAYAIGCKFFVESDLFFTHRAKNFRRKRRGLEPLGIDQCKEVTHLDEFKRG